MIVKLSRVQQIVIAASLLVLNVLLTRILGYLMPGGIFSFNRITLGPAIIIFASLLLGPLFGFVVGAGGDALGWVIMGQWTGVYNIFITLFYGLLGIIPWALMFVIKKIKMEWKYPYHVLGVLLILYAILLGFLWGSNIFDNSFIAWGWDLIIAKGIITGISAFLLIGTLIGLFFTGRYFQKRVARFSNMPNPNQISLICLLIEIFIIYAKPICFYLFTNILLGKSLEDAFGVSFSLLVLLSILFAFADIPLNCFAVSWITMSSRKLIHQEVSNDEK